MKRATRITASTLVGALAFPGMLHAQAQAVSGDSEARMLTARMIEAHGGMEAWNRADTVGFEHVLYMGSMPPEMPHWMISKEVHERRTGRSYADYPLWDAFIAHDGEKTWSLNWNFPNPPEQMLGIHYLFAFLPWLSQEDGVVLTDQGTGTLPEDATEYRKIDVAFPAGGAPMTLFISEETHRLAGFEIHFGAGRTAHHRIEGYTEMEGLLFPSDWITYTGPDQEIIGYHALMDVTLAPTFDESRMRVPEGAVIAGSG